MNFSFKYKTFVIVASAFLWWTYVGFKTTLDQQEQLEIPLLEVDIDSEQAFLIYAVVATVFTVINYVLLSLKFFILL